MNSEMKLKIKDLLLCEIDKCESLENQLHEDIQNIYYEPDSENQLNKLLIMYKDEVRCKYKLEYILGELLNIMGEDSDD